MSPDSLVDQLGKVRPDFGQWDRRHVRNCHVISNECRCQLVASTTVTVQKPTPALIALSGLPGVGKTTLARRLSAVIGSVHARLDTIEAAMTASGVIDRAGGWAAVPDVGYRASDVTGHRLGPAIDALLGGQPRELP
jgi:ATP-dependent protease HslVU (ClpYQ) ATPase subunit